MRRDHSPPLVLEPGLVPADNRILYFARDRAGFRFLSHFHPAVLEIEGELWPTVEHYYQFHRSLDPDYQAAIRSAVHPSVAKQLAAPPTAPRKVSKRSWFRKHNAVPRPDWDEIKLDVMRRGDSAKYAQHPMLAELLLATGDAELVEDSPREPFWGTGPDGTGLNWAGRILMDVRTATRSSNPFPRGGEGDLGVARIGRPDLIK